MSVLLVEKWFLKYTPKLKIDLKCTLNIKIDQTDIMKILKEKFKISSFKNDLQYIILWIFKENFKKCKKIGKFAETWREKNDF